MSTNPTQSTLTFVIVNWDRDEDWPSEASAYRRQLESLVKHRDAALAFAKDNLSHASKYRRYLAADILDSIEQDPDEHQPELADVPELLIEALQHEKNLAVQNAICRALSVYKLPKSATDVLLQFAKSDEPAVRYWCAESIYGFISARYHPKKLVAQCIVFTTDHDADIRDRAVFNIGNFFDYRYIDTPELRQAVVDRLKDRHSETRSEAFRALSYVKDERAIMPLLQWLKTCQKRSSMSPWAIEAAGNYGLPLYFDLLSQIAMWYQGKNHVMTWALRRCSPDSSAREDLPKRFIDFSIMQGDHKDIISQIEL